MGREGERKEKEKIKEKKISSQVPAALAASRTRLCLLHFRV